MRALDAGRGAGDYDGGMSMEMQIAVILPAAGQGERFAQAGGKGRKLDQMIGGKAVLARSVELFNTRPQVRQILVAADPDSLDEFKFRWNDKLNFLNAQVVEGGRKERWETVLNAMKALKPQITHVAVHDAARPVTDGGLIDRMIEAAAIHPAVIPGVRVRGTLKRAAAQAEGAGQGADPLDDILGAAGKSQVRAWPVERTVDRTNLWEVQTPQIFKRDLLEKAYAQIAGGKLDGRGITDDAGLVEALGSPVMLIEGDLMNVKITTPEDLKLAEAVVYFRSGQMGKDKLGDKRKFQTWAQMDEE